MSGYELGDLGNDQLLAGLLSLVRRGNELNSDVLAHLAEVDARGLHWELGYASLFSYCTEKLGLSESAAGRRIAAARLCRRFPEAFSLVARGQLLLSALCALGAHLTPANAPLLFAACSWKSRRCIDQILAAYSPRPDVRDSIRRLPMRPSQEAANTAVFSALQVPRTPIPMAHAPMAHAPMTHAPMTSRP